MRFVPLDTFTIATDKTRAEVFAILHTHIASNTSFRVRNITDQSNKRYVGTITNNGATFTPQVRQPHGSTLVLKTLITEQNNAVTLKCRIIWHAVDYMINGIILLYFAAMAALSVRHMIRMAAVRFVDLLPLSLFVFAYILLMLVFNRTAKQRKAQLIKLFTAKTESTKQPTHSHHESNS